MGVSVIDLPTIERLSQRKSCLSQKEELARVGYAKFIDGREFWPSPDRSRLSDDWDLLNLMTGGSDDGPLCTEAAPAFSRRHADQGAAAQDADDVSASNAGVHAVSGPFAG